MLRYFFYLKSTLWSLISTANEPISASPDVFRGTKGVRRRSVRAAGEEECIQVGRCALGWLFFIFVILPNETADKLSWLRYLQKELMGNLLMKQVSQQKMPVHQNVHFGYVCCSPRRKDVSSCGWVSWSKPRRFKGCHVNKMKWSRSNRRDRAAKARLRFDPSPDLWASGLLPLGKIRTT